MKLRFGVDFGELEVDDLSKPLVLVLDEKEFNRMSKHFEAEGILKFDGVYLYNPDKFTLESFSEDSDCIVQKINVAIADSKLIPKGNKLKIDFFNKYKDLVDKTWANYQSCVEKGRDDCDEPVSKAYYRVIIIFDPELRAVKDLYFEIVLHPGTLALRHYILSPERIISIV